MFVVSLGQSKKKKVELQLFLEQFLELMLKCITERFLSAFVLLLIVRDSAQGDADAE